MTYSIAARCPQSGAFGIAITSSSICVASRCAWVGPLGAVLTQNVTDPSLGPAGLALLRQGLGAPAVLQLLISGTPEPEWRQIGVIDRYGRTAQHSGARIEDIVKITIYITDRAYREPVYQVIGRWLKGVHPVSTGLIVQGLARPELLMEIDIVAEIDNAAPGAQ